MIKFKGRYILLYLQKRIRSLFYFRKHYNSTITMIKIRFDSPKIEIWYGPSQLFQANAHLSQSLPTPLSHPDFLPSLQNTYSCGACALYYTNQTFISVVHAYYVYIINADFTWNTPSWNVCMPFKSYVTGWIATLNKNKYFIPIRQIHNFCWIKSNWKVCKNFSLHE